MTMTIAETILAMVVLQRVGELWYGHWLFRTGVDEGQSLM
jgi:hypothetical protein